MKYLLLAALVACAAKNKTESDLWSRYAGLLEKYPAKETHLECKRPDVKTSKLAQQYKSTVDKEAEIMVKPNFNGVYRLINIPGTMGGQWIVSDCKTGKFVKGALQGEVLFSLESALVVRNPPGVGETIESFKAPAQGKPEVYLFDAASGFVKQDNPIQ